MLTAKQARMHVYDHRQLLLNPTVADVMPFIERSAKMGGVSVFYGVDENIETEKLDKLIASIEALDYKVKTQPSNGLIALEIMW